MPIITKNKRQAIVPKFRVKLSYGSSPHEINIALKILQITQEDLAKVFKVKQASISYAVNNDPLLKKLRISLIDYLNVLQGFIRRVA